MKLNKKQFIKDIILIILGNFILAVGVACFSVPNDILSGGVAGIAIAIEPLLPFISTTTMITILTVVLFVAGAFLLGKNFAIKTLASTILYPFFVSIITPFMDIYTLTDDPILASLYGGAIAGMGVGVVFKTGASTGGMDIPALIIHKYTHISLGSAVIIVDALTLLLGLTIHGIEPALIGFISVWVGGYVVNWTMMVGSSSSKSLMIISDYYEQILDEIHTKLNRGTTLLEAKGGYTSTNRKVLMVVISTSQFPLVNRIIHAIDPNAFVIVHEVHEVRGEGFSFELEEL